MKAKYLFVAATLVAGNVMADEASKQKKVFELMAVTGIEKSIMLGAASCKEIVTQIMQRQRKPQNADQELLQRLDEIGARTAVTCDEVFVMNESKMHFAKHLSDGMSELDLSETLKFLKGAAGQRYLVAQSNATMQFSADLEAKSVQAMTSMAKELTKQIQDEMAKFRVRTGSKGKQIAPDDID